MCSELLPNCRTWDGRSEEKALPAVGARVTAGHKGRPSTSSHPSHECNTSPDYRLTLEMNILEKRWCRQTIKLIRRDEFSCLLLQTRTAD